MKKFKYRLESLLKVKEHLEKEKQKAHAYALKRVSDQEETLDGIDHTRTSTLDGQRRAMSGTISLTQALSYTRYLLRLKKDSMAGRELLRVFEKSAEEKREQLVEASRQRQIYDKLKEKTKARYLKQMAQAEQKQADEMANVCFLRNSTEG